MNTEEEEIVGAAQYDARVKVCVDEHYRTVEKTEKVRVLAEAIFERAVAAKLISACLLDAEPGLDFEERIRSIARYARRAARIYHDKWYSDAIGPE